MLKISAAIALGVLDIQKTQAQVPIAPKVDFEIAPVFDDGRVRFSFVTGAVLLSNGTIVIADSRDSRVVLLRKTGEVTKVVGRNGEGPGEFKGMWSIGECAPDTAYVYDRTLRRMTLITASGTVARTIPMTFSPTSMSCSRSGVIILPHTPEFKGLPTGEGVKFPIAVRLTCSIAI